MSKSILALVSIVVIALVTLVIRSMPFIVFSSKRKIPEIVNYLGKTLTPAIIVILVVFCIKDTTYPFGYPELISIAVTSAIQLWRKNTVLSIGLGTASYMLLIRLPF